MLALCFLLPVDFSLFRLHRSRELVQCLVEIVHLRQNAEPGDDGKNVGRGLSELVVAPQCELQGNTESLDRHDRDGANSRADRNVNERVLLSVQRSYPVDHDGREDGHGKAIGKES